MQIAGAVGVELLSKGDLVYEWRERLFKEFESTISKNAKPFDVNRLPGGPRKTAPA